MCVLTKQIVCLQAQSDFSPQKSLSGDGSIDGAGSNLESAEGFICPSCMRGFSAPEDLERHYLIEHSNTGSPGSGSGNNLSDLKDEVQELQTTLKVRLSTFTPPVSYNPAIPEVMGLPTIILRPGSQ